MACLEDPEPGLGCIPLLPSAMGQADARWFMLPAQLRPVVDGDPRIAPVRGAHAALGVGAVGGRQAPHQGTLQPLSSLRPHSPPRGEGKSDPLDRISPHRAGVVKTWRLPPSAEAVRAHPRESRCSTWVSAGCASRGTGRPDARSPSRIAHRRARSGATRPRPPPRPPGSRAPPLALPQRRCERRRFTVAPKTSRSRVLRRR